jgi:hypothetical protein
MDTAEPSCYGPCRAKLLWTLQSQAVMDTAEPSCYGPCRAKLLWTLQSQAVIDHAEPSYAVSFPYGVKLHNVRYFSNDKLQGFVDTAEKSFTQSLTLHNQSP